LFSKGKNYLYKHWF